MQHSESVWKRFGSNLRCQSRREFTKTAILAIFGLSDPMQRNFRYGLPRTKFCLGQRVMRQWVNDDTLHPCYGRTHVDYGVVVGMVYQMPGTNSNGWSYWVKWYKLSLPTIVEPIIDYADESELQIFTQVGKR